MKNIYNKYTLSNIDSFKPKIKQIFSYDFFCKAHSIFSTKDISSYKDLVYFKNK